MRVLVISRTQFLQGQIEDLREPEINDHKQHRARVRTLSVQPEMPEQIAMCSTYDLPMPQRVWMALGSRSSLDSRGIEA